LREEYLILKSKIIEQMNKIPYVDSKEIIYRYGEFFPAEISPWAYNETIAEEYFPLTKEQALSKGYRWEDDIPRTKDQETISIDELPKIPNLFTNELTEQVLKCNTCTNNYRLTSQEILFYKRLNISIPSDCFNCRHEKRMKLRNARTLYDGFCAKCGDKFQTSYNSEQQKEYKIYCESCYNNEIV
ncbi:MAG: hypothetical protein WCK10_01090, partial [Candidatus Staskawiczbacteria bacterium]